MMLEVTALDRSGNPSLFKASLNVSHIIRIEPIFRYKETQTLSVNNGVLNVGQKQRTPEGDEVGSRITLSNGESLHVAELRAHLTGQIRAFE